MGPALNTLDPTFPIRQLFHQTATQISEMPTFFETPHIRFITLLVKKFNSQAQTQITLMASLIISCKMDGMFYCHYLTVML